ncbi:MAG: hypothetical protein K8I29_11045 [Alphaproteobacteria bacterium]|uniref:DsrE family protein n=1 Tax=Candidatus Nitrobium versatile TaxID=2884831 RepID=A0A953JB78_9BACT|nr:hypothetical protein [Candidatus Nitrobium versatile]
MAGNKKIAVIVKERRGEAFRMCMGLTVLEDTIDVFAFEAGKEGSDSAVSPEEIREMGVTVHSCEEIPPEELSARLLEYDTVLRY